MNEKQVGNLEYKICFEISDDKQFCSPDCPLFNKNECYLFGKLDKDDKNYLRPKRCDFFTSKYKKIAKLPNINKILNSEDPSCMLLRRAKNYGKLPQEYEMLLIQFSIGGNFYEGCEYIKLYLQERLPKIEGDIVQDPNLATAYAAYVIQGRWPEAEPYILKNTNKALYYATHVIKGRWKELESLLLKSKDTYAICHYAEYIIKRRWPKAEPIILEFGNPWTIYYYTKWTIGKRWRKAEPTIKQDSQKWAEYCQHFNIKE